MALNNWGERDGSPAWRAAEFAKACDADATLSEGWQNIDTNLEALARKIIRFEGGE